MERSTEEYINALQERDWNQTREIQCLKETVAVKRRMLVAIEKILKGKEKEKNDGTN